MWRGVFALDVFAVVAISAGVYIAACNDTSHVFQARPFNEEAGCLDGTEGVDVVVGDVPDQCDAACLVQPIEDGGRRVYIATMCSPYPFGFDISGTNAVCANAFGAFARNDSCLADGGSSNPLPLPVDAAPE